MFQLPFGRVFMDDEEIKVEEPSERRKKNLKQLFEIAESLMRARALYMCAGVNPFFSNLPRIMVYKIIQLPNLVFAPGCSR